MFVAMNRFSIAPGRGGEFEETWRSRETHLKEVPGFIRFALLKGDTEGEYVSHSTWASREAFDAWTKSEQFRMGHASPLAKGVLADHPRVSLYEAVLTEGAP